MKIFLSLQILFPFLLINVSLHAQTKTNLDVFKTLVDSSIAQIFNNTTDLHENIYLNLKLGTSYNIFEDQVYLSIQALNKQIVSVNNPLEHSELSHSIENALVNYGEIVRDGFLGGHFVTRKISLWGSYRLHNNNETIAESFNFESVDSVNFDEIQSLENSSYPFTKGEIPSEPFFSNLFEPLVAIGTAAVVIALFFTVRSK